MVESNSTLLLAKIIADAILIRMAECNLTDLTQFMAEVTLISNILGVFSTLFIIIYIKITCPHLGYEGTPRAFHSSRYQIVPYKKAISKEEMRSD